MNVVRNEIRTGLLVILSVLLLAGVLVYLEAPGFLETQHSYNIYFDDVGGIQPGAPVMLAGRKVGQVVRLFSPVPENERQNPGLQALVVVSVKPGTQIHRDVKVYMAQYSLLGQMVIDFTGGTENSGLAPSGSKFVGVHQLGLNDAAPKLVEQMEPVTRAATKTFEELAQTAKRLTAMTAEGGDLSVSLDNFRQTTDHLAHLSGSEGQIRQALADWERLTNQNSALWDTLKNADQVTGNLARNPDINPTLKNLHQASEVVNKTIKDLKITLKGVNKTVSGANNMVQGLNATVRGLQPGLNSTVHNATQFTDTIKRQPWRLIWPSTKNYSGEKTAKTKRTLWAKPESEPAPARVAERREKKAKLECKTPSSGEDELPPPPKNRHGLEYYLRKDP